jgi:hypothetical protein
MYKIIVKKWLTGKTIKSTIGQLKLILTPPLGGQLNYMTPTQLSPLSVDKNRR